MSSLLRDCRYSVRLLARTPAFTVVAVLVLAAGIGTNAAIFTLVNQTLLAPRAADRAPGAFVGLYAKDRTQPGGYRGFSYPEYVDVRDGHAVFSQLTAYTMARVGVTEGDTTRRAIAGVVSSSYFATLATPLATGRAFTAEEERPGARIPVAIVSHAFWRARGSDPAIVGRALRIQGRSFTIVGVTPEGFTGTTALVAPEIYLPLGVHDIVTDAAGGGAGGLADREARTLVVAGRLRPGLSETAAAPALDDLARRLERTHPVENENIALVTERLSRFSMSPWPQDDTEVAAVMAVLMAIAGIVLVVASLNLANMLLARSSARRREIGVRLALGAGRGRIVRQLLVEGVCLSAAGGGLGLLVAWWLVGLLDAPLVAQLPVVVELDATPDVRVLGATLACSMGSVLVFGLWPARRLSRIDVSAELKRGAADLGGGRWLSLGNTLVAGQIALSLALVALGGLFLRGAMAATRADPGFPLERGLVALVDPSLAGWDETRGRQAFVAALERLRGLAGVRAASLASAMPFSPISEFARTRRVGAGGAGGEASTYASLAIVGADYFASIELPVLGGREFTAAEETSAAGAPVAIVDATLAADLFPGEDPIGQHVQMGGDGGDAPSPVLEIVGVVPAVRDSLFDTRPTAHVYLPFGRHYRAGMFLHAKLASGDRAAAAAALGAARQALYEVDARLPVVSLETLESFADSTIFLWIARMAARLVTTLGALALLLAALGVYGVKAYLVSLRRREIGIRMALGAGPGDVLWLVTREGLAVTAAGVAAGLGLAALGGQVVGSYVYRVGPFDPVVFTLAPVALALAALAATWIPARRATRVAPTVALRSE